MSRWADDPERAADELIRRSLDAVGLGGRILLANQGGLLPSLVGARGLAFDLWNRRLVGSGKAEPWPSAGAFDVALLRLPRAKDEQKMAAHACLSVLAPGGRLIVYGGNEEGIRSAASMIEELCGGAETMATRGHGRVLQAPRPVDPARLRASLAAWRSTVSLAIGNTRREWVSYPGIFAADRIDEGTSLLIDALPPLRAGARVLDYACGSGVIGASAATLAPGIVLDALDNDSVALEAARENVPGARLLLGADLADTGGTLYDAILSNPPLHKGLVEDHAQLEQLIAEVPAHLEPGGILQIVVQRRVPLDWLLAKHFATATIAAENGRYRVWRAHGIPPAALARRAG
jgi:16S rRNA (guanine1207-N2)-methyltransferase